MENQFDKSLSVLIFTLNEEKNIEVLLKSLNWIKNIIVVDSLSTDKTLEIVKKYTQKIFQIKSKGFVESVRNYGISKIKTEWILILDADETLKFNLIRQIELLTKNEKFDGYWFPRRQFINKKTFLKYGYFYPDWQLRFFRNNKGYKYSGKIHDPINIPLNKTKRINNIFLVHNSSHSKYRSFLSLIKFINYIKFEGQYLSKMNITNIQLILNIINETFRHFFRSFIKKRGYLDGYFGLQAAINYGLYQGLISLFALLYRNKILKK